MTVLQPASEPRLLLIDDDIVVLRALSGALSRYGHVRFATKAEDALTLLDQEPADLLLVDAELPGMSGLALLEVLARRPAPRARAVLITGHRQPAIEASARLLGAVGVLYKPFTPEAIGHSVSAALAHAQTRSADAPCGLDALLIDPFRVLVMASDMDADSPAIESIASVCGWVEYTATMEQALKRTWDQSLDAIVVTPSLRHGDAIEIIRLLRAEPSLMTTPIIVSQDAESQPDELLALQAGASDVLRPGTPGRILQARLVNQMRGKRYAEFALAAMRP